jgi:predicted ATPase
MVLGKSSPRSAPRYRGSFSKPWGSGVEASRYPFRYAIRAVLERLAARRPVLLALDDVHWADPASLDVIAHPLRRFRGPLLIALASRNTPARLAAGVEEATRVGFGTRLDLGPLTSDEANALIDPELDSAIRGALYRESGGNPFYLEQLVRSRPGELSTAATSEQPSGSWTLPPAVAAAIDAELDPITGDCRVVLDAAAIIGEFFGFGIRSYVGRCTTGRGADGDLGPTLARQRRSWPITLPPAAALTMSSDRRSWATSARSRCLSRLLEERHPGHP